LCALSARNKNSRRGFPRRLFLFMREVFAKRSRDERSDIRDYFQRAAPLRSPKNKRGDSGLPKSPRNVTQTQPAQQRAGVRIIAA
jgi:hypothetical protein